jgi:hypothetical protein
LAYSRKNKTKNKKRSQKNYNNHNIRRPNSSGMSDVKSAPAMAMSSTNESSLNSALFGTGVLDYQERLSRGHGSNTKTQRYYNTRKDKYIVKGDKLTTPLRKRVVLNVKDQTDKLKMHTIWLKKAKLPVTGIAYALVVSFIVSVWVYSFTSLNKYASDINETKENISAAYTEELYLTRQLELKDNLSEFERIAVEELGMVKENSLPKRYVSLKNKDKVEKINSEEDLLTKIANSVPQFFEVAPKD